MPPRRNELHRLRRVQRIHHRHRSRSPARHVHLLCFVRSQRIPGRHAIRINEVPGMPIPQIHARQAPLAPQIPDYSERISQIVRNVKRVAVGTQRQSQRIHGLLIVLYARRSGYGREPSHGQIRRGNFRVRPVRGRRDRPRSIRPKAEHPNFVLVSARNVQRERAARIRMCRERTPHHSALRAREINVLDHFRRRLRVEIDHRQRLLRLVGRSVELDSKSAVHANQISPAAVLRVVVRTAHKRHRHRAHRRLPGSGVQHQRTRRRNRPPFGRRRIRRLRLLRRRGRERNRKPPSTKSERDTPYHS